MRRFTHRIVVAPLVLTVLAVLAGCQSSPQTGDAGESVPAELVSPDRFAAAVAEPGRVTVNVHVPFEGDVAGTDLSVPYDRVSQLADRLPPPGTPLAIYCRSGTMSAEAAPVLADLGYDDIVELRGGMLAWAADGRRLRGPHKPA